MSVNNWATLVNTAGLLSILDLPNILDCRQMMDWPENMLAMLVNISAKMANNSVTPANSEVMTLVHTTVSPEYNLAKLVNSLAKSGNM